LPVESMVPRVELPPEIEFTAQVTEVFDEPETVAVNLYEEPARTVAEEGATETVREEPGGGGLVV